MRSSPCLVLGVLGLCLALPGCLAATASDRSDGSDGATDDGTAERPIPIGPAVERAEASKLTEVTAATRVVPGIVLPETHPPTTLGRSSPTTAR